MPMPALKCIKLLENRLRFMQDLRQDVKWIFKSMASSSRQNVKILMAFSSYSKVIDCVFSLYL